jgi:hypothetical protein
MAHNEDMSTHGLVQMEQNLTVSISKLVINSLEMRKGWRWRVLAQRLLLELL